MILKNVNNMSEQDVVDELRANGIQVILKPVALIPNDLDSCGNTRFFKEIDIYQALNRLQSKGEITMDPFSECSNM